MRKVLFLLTASALMSLAFSCSRSGNGSEKDSASEIRQEAVETAPDEGRVAGDGLPTVIDFNATWCPPCRAIGPVFEKLSEEYEGRMIFRSIDVDQYGDLADQYGITSIPAFVFLDASGQEVKRIVGADEEALRATIAQLAAPKVAAGANSKATEATASDSLGRK